MKTMAQRKTNSSKTDKRIDSLNAFLYEELQDIYDAEKQLTKALPKVVRAASLEELQQALKEHLEVTNEQVTRLEQVFGHIGKPAKGKPCAGMKGLIEEGNESIKDLENALAPFADLAIISAAQRIEHYEMSAYGTARTLAESLGYQEAADLLQETLDEEQKADETLTEIARTLLEAHAEEERGAGFSEGRTRREPTRASEAAERTMGFRKNVRRRAG